MYSGCELPRVDESLASTKRASMTFCNVRSTAAGSSPVISAMGSTVASRCVPASSDWRIASRIGRSRCSQVSGAMQATVRRWRDRRLAGRRRGWKQPRLTHGPRCHPQAPNWCHGRLGGANREPSPAWQSVERARAHLRDLEDEHPGPGVLTRPAAVTKSSPAAPSSSWHRSRALPATERAAAAPARLAPLRPRLEPVGPDTTGACQAGQGRDPATGPRRQGIGAGAAPGHRRVDSAPACTVDVQEKVDDLLVKQLLEKRNGNLEPPPDVLFSLGFDELLT
jgi:hypothetical protein